MRQVPLALVCALLLATSAQAVELNVDRPGHDYRNFAIEQTNPGPCERACRAEARCRAWTYVRPGIQGPRARCWLKSAIPRVRTSDCCISDIVGDSARTAQAREVQSLLATLGYDPGPIDGKTGRQTRAAIRRFQTAHDLSPDGRISPLLIKGLWAVATTGGAQAPRAEAGETARPAPTAPPSAAPAEDLSDLNSLD